ncbi:MAG: hypothetical protein HXX15_05035 [Rhodopseudomonas sp.]|uniref:hypothetical protein n=1 Tax=Rhodopseudomonas sp. TaxID=1078 RepID=UPI0017DFCC93|nr:hypothetical protein [Rhodopseudomonas sp.]NVN85438.1 hypothetical protein [Rhodopseudomonas sp.]
MQRLETTDLKEARRSRIAQFSGRSATLKLGGSMVTGMVRSVQEDKSSETPRWIVTVIPKQAKGQ